MSGNHEPRSRMQRFNERSGTFITFFSNLKTLAVAAVAVVAFGVGMTTEGGRTAIKRVYCQMGGWGVDCEEYGPVVGRHGEAVGIVTDSMRRNAGIEADPVEFTVHEVSASVWKLRWERDGQRRTYLVDRSEATWQVDLITAD